MTKPKKKARTRAERALTFLMAAALVAGSIHWAAADEQEVPYTAPDLYLEQGQTDYDLTEGITYDEQKYELDIVDIGDFNIELPGDYEISYTLTSMEVPTENPDQPGAGGAPETPVTPENPDGGDADDNADGSKVLMETMVPMERGVPMKTAVSKMETPEIVMQETTARVAVMSITVTWTTARVMETRLSRK